MSRDPLEAVFGRNGDLCLVNLRFKKVFLDVESKRHTINLEGSDVSYHELTLSAAEGKRLMRALAEAHGMALSPKAAPKGARK